MPTWVDRDRPFSRTTLTPSLVKRLPLVRRDTQVRLSLGVELVTMPTNE